MTARITAQRLDLALAAALAAAALVQVLAVPIAPRGVGVLVALGSTLPVALRHARPVAAAVAGSAIWLVPTDGYLVVGYVAAFLLFWSLAAEVGDPRVVIGVAAGAVLASIVAAWMNHEVYGEYFGGATGVIAPVLVGRFVRHQRRQARRLEELTRHLELERGRAEQAAVAEERARIARELHDVVAHGVSVIAVQSDAAAAALDRDPALVRAPLRAIHGSATEALAEMRRLLGVLRDEDGPDGLAPQPGLAQLPALIERQRSAGLRVALEAEGEPRPLPASADLSAFRIVQEALTNARRHAPGAEVAVRLAWEPGALRVVVENGPALAGEGPRAPVPGGGGGHGLVGMRERVRLHDGRLEAGPTPAGGWRVDALLRLEALA